MPKRRNAVMMVVSIILSLLIILGIFCVIRNRLQEERAKEAAIQYLKEAYEEEMVYASQSYFMPEEIHFVQFHPKDNPEILFFVYVSGKDIEVWKDDYYEEKAKYELT